MNRNDIREEIWIVGGGGCCCCPLRKKIIHIQCRFVRYLKMIRPKIKIDEDEKTRMNEIK